MVLLYTNETIMGEGAIGGKRYWGGAKWGAGSGNKRIEGNK